MPREPADVVVPFGGADAELPAVLGRLAALRLGPGDTATLADNRGPGAPPVRAPARVRVVDAPEVRSSYHARNRGAAAGSAPWIVFLDADVRFPADLLDRLLDPPPAARVGVLAGGVIDEVVADTPVARALARRGAMGQRRVTDRARPYAQTAHCAVRRAAFTAVGGFAGDVRSGGDADLCFRLAAAGWALEARHDAAVAHEARASLRAVVGQVARHGAGAAWVEERHPGTLPARRLPGLAAWGVRRALAAGALAARGRRDEALDAALDALLTGAFEAGRRGPNRARPR